MSDGRTAPPDGLERRGTAFWQHVTSTFELSESERQVLVEVCRTLDTCDALEVAIADEGLTVPGSKGQPRVHPAVTELRGQRQMLSRLVAQLDLPDESGGTFDSPATVRARKAAQVRWEQRKKERAGGTP